MANYSDIKKIRDKYSWFTLGEKVGLLERQANGTWSSVTESDKTLRIHVTKMADPLVQNSEYTYSYGANSIPNDSFEVDTNDWTADVGKWSTTKQVENNETYRLSYYAKTGTEQLGLPKVEVINLTDAGSTILEYVQPISVGDWTLYKHLFQVTSDDDGVSSVQIKLYNLYGNVAEHSTTVGYDGTHSIKSYANTDATNIVFFDSVKLEKRSQETGINHLEQEPEIPRQFHQGLVYKAISEFYRDPRNMNLEAAQYYEAEYEKIIREAKKFSRKQHISTGYITPRDF